METIIDYKREIWRLEVRLERLLEPRYAEHARAVIARFKDVTHGIRMFGDDSPLADAWEEYKDRMQGQHGVFFDGFVMQFRDVAAWYVDDLPLHELELLWLGTRAFQDTDVGDRDGYVKEDVLDQLCSTIDGIAMNEDIRYIGSDGDDESGGEEEAVTREEARSIAEHYVRRVMGVIISVGEVQTAKEVMREPAIYQADFDLDQCWIAYLKRPWTGMLRSSEILVISMATGAVVYAGSANDEG